jgi:hypothetical protein
MAQYDFGNLSSPLPGTTFFDTHLEPWRDALHSTHKGSSRPSYAVAGTIWLDDTTNPWIVKMYDGTDDISMGEIDTTNNTFLPPNTNFFYGGSAGGTANALTATVSPAISALVAGQVFGVLITAANTAESPTLNINSIGATNTKVSVGGGKVNTPIGALQSGMFALFGYDGTDLIILNPRAYNVATAIATAATVNLDNATGDYVELTGTTSVTAITLGNGQEKTCRCAGAFTLTNGASLILPGGANITTAAGDVFVVRGEPSGVVRVVNYSKASGESVVAGGDGLVLLESQTAANDSSIDFSTGIDSTYDEYELHIIDLVPQTDAADVWMRVSTDGGSSFISTNSYATLGIRQDTGAATTVGGAGGTAQNRMYLDHGLDGVGNAAGESFSTVVKLFNPAGTTNQFHVQNVATYRDPTDYAHVIRSNWYEATTAVDALRILMSTGNIVSGEFKLYGVKKS